MLWETPLDELLFCELFTLVLTTTPKSSAITIAASKPKAARLPTLRTNHDEKPFFPI